jgi:hypothetical protein
MTQLSGLSPLGQARENPIEPSSAISQSKDVQRSENGRLEDISSPFQTLKEAKKEAQKAILRLWPLGVKFQHYIEEGFDENVMKMLFGELHLDMSSGKPSEASQSKTKLQDSPFKPKDSAAPQPRLSISEDNPVSSTQSQDDGKKSDKSEERKDRIARLLAAKAAKAAEIQSTSPPSAIAAPATPPKTKPMGPKELLLQKKMEALQRSREARLRKAQTEMEATLAKAGSHASTQDQALNSSASQPEDKSLVPETTVEKTFDAPMDNTIPLLTSSPQPIQSNTQRKRPVAADFVDYSSSKRPFGKERADSTLVIDVSDGSDDEMDMDMEDESQMESSSTTLRVGNTARKSVTIRDYPPLTDTLHRQYSSPGPTTFASPGGQGNDKRRVIELDKKEKEIMEMRRKIAEAEAKHKAKKSTGGSQTPVTATSTPPELRSRPSNGQLISGSLDGPTAQLISETVSAKFATVGSRVERRGRIVSLHLPHIDSVLQEKMERLKRLREEEERLQAEIDASLAEKSKLTEELDELEEDKITSESEKQVGFGSSGDEKSSAEDQGNLSDNLADLQASTDMPDDGVMGDTLPTVLRQVSEPPPTLEPTDLEGDAERVATEAPLVIDEGPEMENLAGNMSLENPPRDVPMVVVSEAVGSSWSGELVASAEVDGTDQNTNTMLDSAVTDNTQEEVDSKSDSYDPPESMDLDTADQVPLGSPPLNPEHVAESNASEDDSNAAGDIYVSSELLAQISDVQQPREAIQELEAEVTREVHRVLSIRMLTTY